MKNTSDNVIADVINTKHDRIVIYVEENILTKLEFRKPTIGRDIMKNTSDHIINDVINTKNQKNIFISYETFWPNLSFVDQPQAEI